MKQTAAAAPAIIRASVRQHSFTVEQCTPAIGAEIGNINLADAAQDADLIAALRALWLKHKVLFFRDQFITPMEQQVFAEQFGELHVHPVLPGHPEAPKLIMLYRNVATEKPSLLNKFSLGENIWHVDLTYVAAPTRGSVLRCVECPESGGDTMWSNMALAYEKLPDTVKQKIDGLYAKHSFESSFAAHLPADERRAMGRQLPPVEHPVVLTHPETQERVLFVNSGFTTHFANYVNPANFRYGQDFLPEAHHLMDYLIAQAAIPEYQVRLKWRPGTVALWDNLACQHYAVSDYGSAPRRMLRAALKGGVLA